MVLFNGFVAVVVAAVRNGVDKEEEEEEEEEDGAQLLLLRLLLLVVIVLGSHGHLECGQPTPPKPTTRPRGPTPFVKSV